MSESEYVDATEEQIVEWLEAWKKRRDELDYVLTLDRKERRRRGMRYTATQILVERGKANAIVEHYEAALAKMSHRKETP